MIRSPGLQTVMTAHIIASVPPQVTTISVSGSSVRPRLRPALRASASRKFSAPKVTEYGCGPWCAT